ncbi:MAG: dicarboxylate/amino acid:cation symporter [Pseudomonadota bacterium]
MNKTSSKETSNLDLPQIDNRLWINILIGMVLGVIAGLVLSPHGLAIVGEELAHDLAAWIKLPGILFLGLIQMVIVPLVLCSIILGINQSGDLDFVKALGLRAVFYFICTTIIAVSIGMGLAYLIQPGNFIDQSLIQDFNAQQSDNTTGSSQRTFENLTIPDRISNLIPINVTGAIVEKNLLQIVIAAMIVGLALLSIKKNNAQPLLNLCEAGQSVAMKIIGWAMVIAPYAVFGLLCDITIKLGLDALSSMGAYVITVLLGLLSMIIVYSLIVSVVTQKSPLEFFKSIKAVQLLAFSTSSSAATMPFTMLCAEEKLNVKPKVSRFIVPLGATINMDGTALYQVIATIFLIQIFGDVSGVDLSTADLILLIITILGASIGTPATPGVGIVVLATILTGIGLNPAAVGLILGVDRILDMCRTSINVTGDLAASAVMNKFMK